MEIWVVPIAVALIGGPLMWFLSRLDKRNSDQHANSLSVLEASKELISGVDQKLDRLDSKVDKLDQRIYNHLEWHTSDDRNRTS
jgi:hypothetical protein